MIDNNIHNIFINKLINSNKYYKNKEFTILSKYIGSHSYITVKNKYGKLKALPTNLLKNKKLTIRSAINKTEYWINMAKEVHEDKYDYSKVDYINSQNKVIITCLMHGDFEQVANNHLNGQGCPKCGNIESAKSKEKWNTETIKKVLKTIHPKLNFEKSKYFGINNKIAYFCKEHGENKSLLSNLLKGHGCKKCGEKVCNGWTTTEWIKAAKKSKNFDSFKVYILKCTGNEEEFYKIGRTFLTIKRRFNQSGKIPYNYEVVKVFNGKPREICELEKQLQKDNKEFKYTPEISFGGMYECFKIIK